MARGEDQQQQQQQQPMQHDNDAAPGYKLRPAGEGAGPRREHEMPLNQWDLMQIVESAESKLMRGGAQQPGLSDGRNRKWLAAPGPKEGEAADMINPQRPSPLVNKAREEDETGVSSPALAGAGGLASRDDGPTPTNDLFRSLVSKDWRALLGSSEALASARARQSRDCYPTKQESSLPSWRQQRHKPERPERKRQPEVARRRPRTPAAGADASTSESQTHSERGQLPQEVGPKQEQHTGCDRLHAPGPLSDLSAIISKCHTSLQISDSRPYQLAKRALRSVSPRRPDKSGSLSGVPVGEPEGGRSAGAGVIEQPRRHSTYLFPSALAGSDPLSSSSSSSSSDAEAALDDTPATGPHFYLEEARNEHRRHEYEEDDKQQYCAYEQCHDDDDDDDDDEEEPDNYRLDRGLKAEFGRQASNSLRLRNSASSPSALSTPTNQDWQVSCQKACCRPPANQATITTTTTTGVPGELHNTSLSLTGPSRDTAAAGRRGSAVHHRKRHSLINVLQAGAGSAGRRLNPRTLFGAPTSPSSHRNSEVRNSLDCGTSLGSQAYDPLIPESGFKIVVMGTSGSGKTSIIRRYLYNSFSERHNPTVEDTYFVEFPYMKNMINISISDTSGTYQFPAMRKLAINSGDAFILVYSVDSPQSFDELEQLRQNILDERELAYSEGPASGGSSLTSNDSLAGSSTGGSQRSSIGSVCAHQLQPLQQRHQLGPGSGHQQAPSAAGGGGGGELARAGLTASRYWSLGSIFSHHGASASQRELHPSNISQQPVQQLASQTQHQHQYQHQNQHQQPPSSQQSLVQCRDSSVSSSSICSSSCSSSADNSRRSSISAAEAALKTRRTRRPPMVIVANKLDLPADKHLVNSDEIEALAVIDWNNGFVRASAALNINIEDIFQQVLCQAKQPPTLAQAIVSKRRKSLPPKFPTARGK